MATNSEALVPVEAQSALVLPAVDAHGMKQAMTAYTEICNAILEPHDYQTVQGKTFKKRSAWQKLATAFSVSTEIVDRVVHLDDTGRVLRAEFVVRASAPNGRHEDGYGACARSERQFSKPDHDIPATAETRARNRACANLFAFGEMTAEEVEGTAPSAPPAAKPATAAPAPAGKNLRVLRAKSSSGGGTPETGEKPTGGSVATPLDDAQERERAFHLAKDWLQRQGSEGDLGSEASAFLDRVSQRSRKVDFEALSAEEVHSLANGLAQRLEEEV